MSSKAVALFQRLFRSLSRRPVGVTLAVVGMALVVGAASTMPDGRPTPTRQPVPRWLTLKSSEARARMGPGLDYRIMWVYGPAGVPVQVIAETREWRKICDPDGAVAWVHRSVVSSRRAVFNTSNHELPIRAGKSDTSSLRARLAPRSIVAVNDCEDGWCEVRARRLRGWTPQAGVFGGETRALCDASRPAGLAPPATSRRR